MNYQDIQNRMAMAQGTENYNLISPFCRRVVATDSVIDVFEYASCFWIGDVVVSYYPKLKRCDETHIFYLTLKVKDDHSCMFKITREKYDYAKDKSVTQTVASQNIPFTDLPIGEYKFYIGVQPTDENFTDCYYVIMNLGDY